MFLICCDAPPDAKLQSLSPGHDISWSEFAGIPSKTWNMSSPKKIACVFFSKTKSRTQDDLQVISQKINLPFFPNKPTKTHRPIVPSSASVRADEELEPEKVDLASLPVELLEEAKIPMGSFNDVAKAGGVRTNVLARGGGGHVFFFFVVFFFCFGKTGKNGWLGWGEGIFSENSLLDFAKHVFFLLLLPNGDLKMNVFFGWRSRT